MGSDVKYLVMCLFAIFVSSSEKFLFMYFVRFLIRYLFFFLLYTFDISLLNKDKKQATLFRNAFMDSKTQTHQANNCHAGQGSC